MEIHGCMTSYAKKAKRKKIESQILPNPKDFETPCAGEKFLMKSWCKIFMKLYAATNFTPAEANWKEK